MTIKFLLQGQKSRIAALFFPLVSIVLAHIDKLHKDVITKHLEEPADDLEDDVPSSPVTPSSPPSEDGKKVMY